MFFLDSSDLASPQIPGTPESHKTDETKESEALTDQTQSPKKGYHYMLECLKIKL